MSKLDFIISAIFYGGVQSTVKGAIIKTPTLSKEDGKQQIKSLYLELIGEDEKTDPYSPTGHKENQLRAELRKKVEEL